MLTVCMNPEYVVKSVRCQFQQFLQRITVVETRQYVEYVTIGSCGDSSDKRPKVVHFFNTRTWFYGDSRVKVEMKFIRKC